MGFKTMKMGWDICSSPPWFPFYPFTMLQNAISWPSHKKCRKTIMTQKVLVTPSSNIVHCNWHTQKPTCADLQAFANTFSLCKLTFFQFCFVRGSSGNSQNFTFCWFWLGKMHQNCLSGAYSGFKACQIQWHLLQVSMISGSWKITILGDTLQKMGFKTMKMGWDICSSPPWFPFYPYTMFQNAISWPSHKNAEKP